MQKKRSSSIDGQDLMLGANPIAKLMFGSDDRASCHKLYRLVETDHALPIFKLGKQLTARRSVLQKEWEKRERREDVA